MNGMKLGQTTIASVTEFTAGGQWSQWTHDGITETRTYNNLMQIDAADGGGRVARWWIRSTGIRRQGRTTGGSRRRRTG